MEIRDLKNKIVALASVDEKGNPHNIAVEVNRADKNHIIITDNEMQKTKENLLKNPKVALVFWEGEKEIKVKGNAKYYNSGKWLDFVKSLKENKNYSPKGAIVIQVKEIKEV